MSCRAARELQTHGCSESAGFDSHQAAQPAATAPMTPEQPTAAQQPLQQPSPAQSETQHAAATLSFQHPSNTDAAALPAAGTSAGRVTPSRPDCADGGCSGSEPADQPAESRGKVKLKPCRALPLAAQTEEGEIVQPTAMPPHWDVGCSAASQTAGSDNRKALSQWAAQTWFIVPLIPALLCCHRCQRPCFASCCLLKSQASRVTCIYIPQLILSSLLN